MQEAYEIARKRAQKSAERGKSNYDNKVRSSVLEEGDHVLVRNMTPRGGTGKLRSHWEDCIYKVVRQVNKDLPIYEVVPEQGRKRDSRILHRNLLLPCNYLPLEIPLEVVKPPKKKSISNDKDDNTAQSENSSDDEDDWYCYLPVQPPPVIQSQADENTVVTETESVNDTVNADSREEPMERINDNQSESHLLDQSCAPNQVEIVCPEEVPAENSTPALASPGPSENPSEALQLSRRPMRERRAPRVFTYNELGKPVCYSVGPPAHPQYLHQVLPHEREIAGMQWSYAVPFLHHQPVLPHGY